MADAWKEYIDQIVDKYDWNTMQVKHYKECEEAAIFGLDGAGWYWSPGFPDINADTQVTIEGMTPADTKVIDVNEFKSVLGATNGNKDISGQGAGIRIGGKKYMMTRHDPTLKLAQMSCPGGGAAAMQTATGLVVALFVKDKPCVDQAGQPVAKAY